MKRKILYWASRTLAILAILFMMMFSLDCFDSKWEMKDQLVCLLMHNIPAFIILLVLAIAWRWELAGGILFLLASLVGIIYFRGLSGNSGVLIIMLPFTITGVLFILLHFLSKKTEHLT